MIGHHTGTHVHILVKTNNGLRRYLFHFILKPRISSQLLHIYDTFYHPNYQNMYCSVAFHWSSRIMAGLCIKKKGGCGYYFGQEGYIIGKFGFSYTK